MIKDIIIYLRHRLERGEFVTVIWNLMIAVAGALAAWYWYRSSKVRYPDNLHSITPLGGAGLVLTEPWLKAVQEGGRLNKIAASWSAVAAFLGALSLLLSSEFVPPPGLRD
jgi:hypothetical protein